jgi:thymidylate synthase (FAD)
MREVRILTGEPIVVALAEMNIINGALAQMMNWVRERRPECLPEEWLEGRRVTQPTYELFPHELKHDDGSELTDNELLVEVAGRKCYDSWGAKAGKKSNREYIEHTQQGDIPHASIMYHAKTTFFIAGVSRRVSHELIRNYVGADRDEEGSPSQESTRYTEHPGCYIAHPWILDSEELDTFRIEMENNYVAYSEYIERQMGRVQANSVGPKMTTLARKRIFESASAYLSHSCETSWIWTTNPMALAKLFRERGSEGADLEFRRLAKTWARVCVARWPNLFPQPWVRELAS